MLHPEGLVLVFTREDSRDDFTSQGCAQADHWEDTEPVTIWWRFHDPNRKDEPEEGDAPLQEGEPEGVSEPGAEDEVPPSPLEEPEDVAQGAGFGGPQNSELVERAAVDYVTALYQSQGWTVLSVGSEKVGYDLACTRGSEERHVEVKGVAGLVPSFLLTEGERRRAATDPLWRAAIVTGALGPDPQLREVTGAHLLARWTLNPVTWRVSAPPPQR